MKNIIFWDMTPCSPLEPTDVSEEHIASIFRIEKVSSAGGRLSCWFLAELISSTLKMEAICSAETSVDSQRTTWRHIPENDTLCRPIGYWNEYRFAYLNSMAIFSAYVCMRVVWKIKLMLKTEYFNLQVANNETQRT
jgi:hypothetical protein